MNMARNRRHAVLPVLFDQAISAPAAECAATRTHARKIFRGANGKTIPFACVWYIIRQHKQNKYGHGDVHQQKKNATIVSK